MREAFAEVEPIFLISWWLGSVMLHLFSGELERLADFFPQFWGCVRGEGSEGHTSSEAVEVGDVFG